MGWIETFELKLKVVTKDNKEISYVDEQTTSSYTDADNLRIAIISPYTLCLAESIEQFKKMIKDGFIYNKDYRDELYIYKKAVSCIKDNSKFIKEIQKIKSMDDIKSVEISQCFPNRPNVGEVIHKFDIENVTYELTNTVAHDFLTESQADIIKFNPHLFFDSEPIISMYNDTFEELPYKSVRYGIYNHIEKCLVCPNCGKKIDKDNCYIDRKHNCVVCDEYCVPDSRYAMLRHLLVHEKRCVVNVELVHTRDGDRPQIIEKAKPGCEVSFQFDKKNNQVDVLTAEGSIGLVTRYVEGYDLMCCLSKLKRNDKMFKVRTTISNVVPASQRPKKGMKPIVEIALEVDVFF